MSRARCGTRFCAKAEQIGRPRRTGRENVRFSNIDVENQAPPGYANVGACMTAEEP